MRCFLLFPALLTAAEPGDFFETRIRPVLAKNCYACHREAALGGLRLDSREAMLTGGKSGASIRLERPEESLLLKAVRQADDHVKKMPPSGKLSDAEIADLATWIGQGAIWPASALVAAKAGKGITPEARAFWSFQPVRAPDVPAGVNAIDYLVQTRLAKDGLKQAPRADRRTLIRRASVDLTGLPPAPEEVDAFLADSSPDAYAKLLDRLLASPRYGERWGRVWLDVARYSDDLLNSTKEEPYQNSFRYRNWVIEALNQDLPYNDFVKAQIAGDQTGHPAALGFYALSPEMQDDRVDATTRGFLGLTVACAQCHDHKFDPIPTRDFYSLQGVFANTRLAEKELAPKETVAQWKALEKNVKSMEEEVARFYERQTELIGEIEAAKTARYLLAARGLGPKDGLDEEILKRWTAYQAQPRKDHAYLDAWQRDPSPQTAHDFQEVVLAVNREQREIETRNDYKKGGKTANPDLAQLVLESIEYSKYVLWRSLFERSIRDSAGFFASTEGVYYFGKGKVDRFLPPAFRDYAKDLERRLAEAKKALPAKYPFLQVIEDKDKVQDIKVSVRGDRNNLGELAPRGFPQILSEKQKLFTKGSGRLELGEAIADPANPLTARVIVNRVWQQHFGRGIVATPSNFGQLGERPTHPELLDWLADRFVKQGWSLKQLHRDIMSSETYQLASAGTANMTANLAKDPDNVLLWRSPRRRLDAESMRDAMLFVSGELDLAPGGLAVKLDDEGFKKRTVYGFVGRRKLDTMLALFDFPNPLATSEARMPTNVPPQRLFLMNSPFVEARAKSLAARAEGPLEARVTRLYRLLYGRQPEDREVSLAREFLASGDWTSYARALLGSNEFLFVN
ncbi:MAG: PSD1 and planctomycete cytochrome C domain-containing protein [Bryobacteraceae bacterium]|nr:PSD1 and planctomycete cytochrome C domain-containing protein [Bryobacteraceae bacterium]